jgi:hypothetical protein
LLLCTARGVSLGSGTGLTRQEQVGAHGVPWEEELLLLWLWAN